MGEFHDALGEVVGDTIEDINALGAGADLAGIQKRGPRAGAAGDIEVGIAANDERIVATELAVELLHLLGAQLADALAGFGRTGQRDEIGAGVRDERFAEFFPAAGHDVDDPGRQVGEHVGKRKS